MLPTFITVVLKIVYLTAENDRDLNALRSLDQELWMTGNSHKIFRRANIDPDDNYRTVPLEASATRLDI